MTNTIKHIISINIIIYVYIIYFSKENIDTLSALYNSFDPFFYFFQFISYMFIHSMHIFLHITSNMFILWIYGMNINIFFGPIKFIIFYFTSGVIAGLLQNMLKFLIIYYYTGIFNLYNISHVSMTIISKHRKHLQCSMYSPIIGSSGAIASIIGYYTTLKILYSSKIFIINILVFFKKSPGISHLSHLSGAIVGCYVALSSINIL